MNYGVDRTFDRSGRRNDAVATLEFPVSFFENAAETADSKRITNPQATCLADQISGNQLSMTQKLARQTGLEASSVTEDMFDCHFGELSKSAAAYVIDYLETFLRRSSNRIRLAG